MLANGTPGGTNGAAPDLNLGTGSLTVNGGTLTMDTINAAGIRNGPIALNGGRIITQFVVGDQHTLHAGTWEFFGSGNPINGATMTFTTNSSALIHLHNETLTEVRNEHLDKFFIGTNAAIEGLNLHVASDGNAGNFLRRMRPYMWTATGGEGSLYDEGNWTLDGDGTTPIPQIQGGTAINEGLLVQSGNPGSSGTGATMNLGASGSLIIQGGHLNVGTNYGIQNGFIFLHGGRVVAQFVVDCKTIELAEGELELHGSGNPLNNVTPYFVSNAVATIHLVNESPANTINEHLGKISVAGQPAILNENLIIESDGASGSIIRVVRAMDTDQDGMDDDWESNNNLDPLVNDAGLDPDNDGLTNIEEYNANSNPQNPDSDADGLNDGEEVNIHTTDPAHADSDNDLLSDGEEINSYQTDPINPDTDDDSVPDGLEIARGTDPLNHEDYIRRPNIIFILTDDLGWGDLGILFQNDIAGTKKHVTPHLDQMANEGVILHRHYTPAPVCAPARASLLLGVHQGHANIRDNDFDQELVDHHTLGTLMQNAGYHTAAIGKWGLQGDGNSPATWPSYPTKRGFDYYYGYVQHSAGHQHYPANNWPLGNNTAHRSTKDLYEQDTEVSAGLDKCYTTDLFTARAKQWIIDEVNDADTQPFFMYLAYDTPHAALQLPTMAYPAGAGVNGGLQWLGTAGNMINTAAGTIDSWTHPDYSSTSWSEVEKRFATSVRRIDSAIGDLRQTLDELGIANDTLIIFTSDNGPHSESYIGSSAGFPSNYRPTSFDSYGPFEGMKRDCLEGGIRMPTLAVWPGTLPAGRIVESPSQFHDWMPTFADAAALPPPARTDGVSLLPSLTGEGEQAESTVYIEYNNNGSTPNYGDFDIHSGTSRRDSQVIYLDGYKGIRHNPANHSVPFRIYDTTTDYEEATNLTGSSTFFTDLESRMREQVLKIRRVSEKSAHARPWDNALVQPVSPATVPGLNCYAHEGRWPWLPDFTLLRGGVHSIQPLVQPNGLTRSYHSGAYLAGFINVPTNGTWTFYGQANGELHMRIHDAQVFNGAIEKSGNETQGSLNLAAGLHPIHIHYHVLYGSPALTLAWEGPGVPKAPVPASALFRLVDTDGDQDPDIEDFDDDNDGLNDDDEAIAGTDPLDATDTLMLRIETTATAGEASLLFPSKTGRRYTIERRDTLENGAWQTVVFGIIGDNTSKELFDQPQGALPFQAYRLTVEETP